MQVKTSSKLSFHGLLAIALASLLGACGGSDSEKLKAARLTEGCALNSQCENPLVCAFERCHQECEEDRDCPSSERCVRSDLGNVCQLEMETSCSRNSDCSGDQVCGDDGECRDECESNDDCTKGQLCAKSSECASMSSEKDTLDAQMNIVPQKSTAKATAGRAAAGAGGAMGKAGSSAPSQGSIKSGASASGEACSQTGSMSTECDGTKTSEVEPNDVKAEATPICLGATVSGEIADMDKVDTYRVATPSHSSGGYLTVKLNPSQSQLDLYLRNSTEAVTFGGYARAPADGQSVMWIATAPGQSYLIDVKPILSGSPYEITTEWQAIEDCYEPNDDRMSAKAIELDKSVTAYFHAGVLETGTEKYIDWYALTLEAGELVVRCEALPSNVQPAFALFDSKGAMVKSAVAPTAGAQFELVATLKESGEYTLSFYMDRGPLLAGTDEVLPNLTTPYTFTATQP